MQKIDFKKVLKHLYLPSVSKIERVDVPPMNYLMVDGKGDPNTVQSYREAVGALFTLAYALKFMIKKGPLALDYGVMPLEGLWWADNMATFSVRDKSNWKWTMMIMQPDFITSEMVATATDEVRKKKNPAALSKVRFESFAERVAAQTLHIGPFAEEGPTIERIHSFILDSRHQLTGKHHEIYLSDIRRAAPKNWKTVIRQPMK
jgi:hypothetical protein